MADLFAKRNAAKTVNPEAVDRITKVWGDRWIYDGVATLHPLIASHLECLFDDVLDGVDLSDREILDFDVLPGALRRAEDARTSIHGPMGTYENGLFPVEGVAILTAPPKSGKSLWLVDRLFQWRDDANDLPHARVLYIALESERSIIAAVEGRKGLQREQGIKDPARVVVAFPKAGEIDLTDPDSIRKFADSLKPPSGLPKGVRLPPAMVELKRVDWPTVVVLDSFSRALAGHDENTSSVMSAAVQGLSILREALHASLLVVVHHPAQGGTLPRGHGSLLGGVDAVVRMEVKGKGVDAITQVTCTHGRDIADGPSTMRRYTRRATTWTDPSKPGREFAFVEFADVTDTPTKPPSGPKTAPAAPTKATTPTAPPKAPAAPTTPPSGPALRGLPAKVWAALALVPGQRMAVDVARERVVNGPAFEGVDTARRAQRWGEVLASLEAKGLVVDGHLCHPAQPSAEDDLL